MSQRTIYRWRRKTSSAGAEFQYVTSSTAFPTSSGAAGYEAYDTRNKSSDFTTSDPIISDTRTHVHISEIILHLRCRPNEWYGKADAEQCNFRMTIFDDAYFDFTCVAHKDSKGNNIFYNYTFSSNDREQLDNLEEILVKSQSTVNYWSSNQHSVRFKSLDTYKYGLELQSASSMDDCNYVDIIYIDDSSGKTATEITEAPTSVSWSRVQTKNGVNQLTTYDTDITTLYRCTNDTAYELNFSSPKLTPENNAITGYAVLWNNSSTTNAWMQVYTHTFVGEEWNFDAENPQTFSASLSTFDWPSAGSYKKYQVCWLDAYGSVVLPETWAPYTLTATLDTTKLALIGTSYQADGTTPYSENQTDTLWVKPSTNVKITAANDIDDTAIDIKYEYWIGNEEVSTKEDFEEKLAIAQTTTFKEIITYTNLLCAAGDSNVLTLEYPVYVLSLSDLAFAFFDENVAKPYDVANLKYYTEWSSNDLTGTQFLKGSSANIQLNYKTIGEWNLKSGIRIHYQLYNHGEIKNSPSSLNIETGAYSSFQMLAAGKTVTIDEKELSPLISGIAGQGQTIKGIITLTYPNSEVLVLETETNVLFVPACDVTKINIIDGLNAKKSIQSIANNVSLTWLYDLPAYAGRITNITVTATTNTTSKSGIVTVTDFSQDYITTGILDYNAVSILGISGGATFTLGLTFTDEFGNISEVKSEQITDDKTIELSFIRVAMVGLSKWNPVTSGKPTTDLELSFTVTKPATIANWSDIEYRYCLKWSGLEHWTAWTKYDKIVSSDDLAEAALEFKNAVLAATLFETEYFGSNFKALFQEQSGRNAYGILDGNAALPVTIKLQARDSNPSEGQDDSIGTTEEVPLTLDYRENFDKADFTWNCYSNLQSENGTSYYTSKATATFEITKQPKLLDITNTDSESSSLTNFTRVLERNGVQQNQFTFDKSTQKYIAIYTFPVITEDTEDKFTVCYTYQYADGSTSTYTDATSLGVWSWVPPTGTTLCFLGNANMTELESQVQINSHGASSGLDGLTPTIEIKLVNGTAQVGSIYSVGTAESKTGVKNWTSSSLIDVEIGTALTPTITVTYKATDGTLISQSCTLPKAAIRAKTTIPLGIRKYGIGINMAEDGDIKEGDPALQVTQNTESTTVAQFTTSSKDSTIKVKMEEYTINLKFSSNGFEVYFEQDKST